MLGSVSCGKAFKNVANQEPQQRDGINDATSEESLLLSVRNGESLNAERALKEGANANLKYNKTETVLTYSILTGQTNMVDVLLNAEADPNLPNQQGKFPLFMAIKTGNKSVLNNLLTFGAQVNLVNQDSMLPLVYATQLNRIEEVFYLLIKGADPLFQGAAEISAYDYAVQSNNREMLNVLDTHLRLEQGKDPKEVVSERIKIGDDQAIEYVNTYLLNQGTDVFTEFGSSLILTTFKEAPNQDKLITLISKYLEWGYGLNQTALIHELYRDELKTQIPLALEYGADPNVLDEKNKPLLWYLTKKLDVPLVEELISFGARTKLSIQLEEIDQNIVIDMCDAVPRKKCRTRRSCPPGRLEAIKKLKSLYSCR
jgi:ankyrin repeat protein